MTNRQNILVILDMQRWSVLLYSGGSAGPVLWYHVVDPGVFGLLLVHISNRSRSSQAAARCAAYQCECHFQPTADRFRNEHGKDVASYLIELVSLQ